ncbi:InlB B-repeat-containing protein [Ruminococcus sp.]|uniref:InlB B-repeat-containing protein n=1 Tax=Ruminococcus sp. TaxID=41978 RepID=UPI002E808919|nr:hypothetical protein [Ruminococcus sp.]MEE3492756.1 hypothetical protein [Ruminococcus sp.]
MRKFKKHVSLLLAFIMVFSLFTIVPVTVHAEDTPTQNNTANPTEEPTEDPSETWELPTEEPKGQMEYLDRVWDEYTQQVEEHLRTLDADQYTYLNDYSGYEALWNDLASGWYVVDRDISLKGRLIVRSGTVNLLLCDGCTLDAPKGIGVEPGAALHIYGQPQGTGKIKSDGCAKYSAVIGGSYFGNEKDTLTQVLNAIVGLDTGDIAIHGGTLDLKSGEYGACIGSGLNGAVGNISVYGGDIKCSAEHGAGIGGGYGGYEESDHPQSGRFNFYGGTVEAKSVGGAGIGSGNCAYHFDAAVSIYGGNVTGFSIDGGAGIGSGRFSVNGVINISGGTVIGIGTAEEKSGAGIGSGYESDDIDEENLDPHNINISGGTILACSTNGAGIGSGYKGATGKINITGGSIIATSEYRGAGIGGGCYAYEIMQQITIENAFVFAYSAGGLKSFDMIEEKLGDVSADNAEVIERFRAAFPSQTYVKSGFEKFMDGFNNFGSKLVGSGDSIKGYGAGIGGGSGSKLGDITIKNSTVYAQGGDRAAGIGSGSHHPYGNITIEDSNISAFGGNHGAGIGGGIESRTYEDTKIQIKNSTVTAKGGERGAGIGTGRDAPKPRKGMIFDFPGTDCIVEIDGSTVEATGGKYAAGIGGGDNTDSKSITIRDNSDVKAYGGVDAAGIGGGEDGNGGKIWIEDSKVYAEGKEFGAGIGGGEDMGVKSVTIRGICDVEAVGGEDGNGCAIGHGDYNKFAALFWTENPSNGDLSIGPRAYTVESGEDKNNTATVSGNGVWAAIREKKYAHVYYCKHENVTVRPSFNDYHASVCDKCGSYLKYEEHTWGADDKCTVCGASKVTKTITLIEQGSDGEVTRTVTVPWNASYMLTEPENTPDGKTFAYWTTDESGMDAYFTGDEIEVDDSDRTFRAVYLNTVKATYLDKDGLEQTVTARRLEKYDPDNENEDYLSYLQSGWYILDQDIAEGGGSFFVMGDVNLILADGVTLSSDDVDFIKFPTKDTVFTVYGQRKQTGTIDKSYIGEFYEFVQYGGVIKTEELTAEYCRVLGGVFEASRLNVNSVTQLGWMLPDNSITVGEYISPVVSVNEGQKLRYVDAGGNDKLISGVLTENEVKTIRGVTLLPEIKFEYHSKPQWTWSDTLAEATATFKALASSGAPDIELKADVERVDDGEELKATATVTFRGQEYTATEKQQIRWNVYVDSVQHGTVNVSETLVEPGEIIEVDAKADEGYEIESISIEPFDSEVEVTTLGDNSFVMPRNNVNVRVNIVRVDPYTITVESPEHGTLTADKATAMAGETVKLTITPDDDYMLKKLEIQPADQFSYVKVTDGAFTMPDCDVTISAVFSYVTYVPQVEPYIDYRGEYVLGTVEHYDSAGNHYAVNPDKSIGEEIYDLSLSYFDFRLLDDDTYQLEHYTGPTDTLTELVIPKTYYRQKITVIGNDISDQYDEKSRFVPKDSHSFTLVLNENITEIKPYSFLEVQVEKVTGDTSNLSMIGGVAFSDANSNDNHKLDIKLDYPGKITVDRSSFGNMKVTARIKHETTFSKELLLSSIDYVFTDAHPYGNPVWTWSNNDTSATANFLCSDSRCKHIETVNATVSRSLEDGKNYLVATAEIDGNTYTSSKPFNYFAYHSLTLGGDIGVNFYLDLADEEIAKGVRVDFTWNDKHDFVTFDSESVKDSKNGCYKATCYVCAAEMSDKITAAITIGDDEQPFATEQYSVKDYATVIMLNREGKFSEKLITLVKTMVNYGTSAQVQFDHNTENPANGTAHYAIEKLTQDEIDSINSDVPDKDAMNAALDGRGIEYYGYSLLLKTKTALRFYFKKNGADTSALSLIDRDGKNVGAVKDYNAEYCYIEVTDIPASKLGENYELKYGDVSLGSYSTFSYVKDVLLNDNDRNLREAVTTLYRYNEAAITYFNSIA